MATPSDVFLGAIEIGRWLSPGLPGHSAAAPGALPSPDLPSLAGRALAHLLRAPLPQSGFSCRQAYVLSSCPPGRHVGNAGAPGEPECRIHRGLSEAREITGRSEGEELDRRLWSALLEAPRGETTPASLGLLLRGLAEEFARTRDQETRLRAREVFASMKALTREKWDLLYFPAHSAADPGRGAELLSPLSSGSAAVHLLSYGKLCQDGEALELCRRLARGIVAGVAEGGGGFREDGSFSGPSAPRLQEASAVAEVAATFADRDMLLWAQRVFEFARRAGGDSGFVPRILPAETPEPSPGSAGSAAAPGSDTCAAAGAACLAAALARAGFMTCYDAVESFLRNHLPLVQFAVTPALAEWYGRRHASRPREEVHAALAAAAADCDGGFISHVAPNDLVVESAEAPPLLMAVCCTVEAVHAMAAAWRCGVTEAGGTVDVNLGLDRETPFVRVTASPAGEGRLAVAVKKPCGLRVRVPSWTDRSGMTVQRNGSPAMAGFDEGYVCLDALRAGETVVVRWPVPVFSQTFTVAGPGGGTRHRWSWVGGTVTGVDPAGTAVPFWPARP